jgi:hypothetical protein
MAEDHLETVRVRPNLIAFLATLALVIGILVGLHAWSDSAVDMWTRGHESAWQFRLIGAIGLAAILVLFWTALRVGRSVAWVFPVLLAVGGALHVYRIIVFSGLLSGGAVYTTAQSYVPDVVWLPLYLLFYFFAMGVWGLLDRTRARTAIERIGRLDLPIAGLALFLLFHYALHAYTRWAGRMSFDSNVLWPTALGVSTVLRPVLLVGAFHALNAIGGAPRRRPFEWALAGVLVGLVLIAPSYALGASLADWAADAAVDVAVIGLAAWALPGFRRSTQLKEAGERLI